VQVEIWNLSEDFMINWESIDIFLENTKYFALCSSILGKSLITLLCLYTSTLIEIFRTLWWCHHVKWEVNLFHCKGYTAIDFPEENVAFTQMVWRNQRSFVDFVWRFDHRTYQTNSFDVCISCYVDFRLVLWLYSTLSAGNKKVS